MSEVKVIVETIVMSKHAAVSPGVSSVVVEFGDYVASRKQAMDFIDNLVKYEEGGSFVIHRTAMLI